MRFLILLGLWLPLFGFLAGAAHAKSFALLVGVSDYDDSIGLADLRGPANDVRLLRDVLSGRGDFDIRMLADGVEGAARPTRAAILDGFDQLAKDVSDGDFVYIHLSGHGTRQSDRNGDETDGLDEVFLPADTQRAEPGSGVIPNAIVDEELGQRIAALRAKGADVWFVLDSCHSGSGLRAGSLRTATRVVDPKALGLTLDPRPQPANTTAVDVTGGEDLPGQYLAFYAAQSSEVAREVLIDETAENGWYGLFTSRLAARMQSDGALSYRQLFQAVMADLADTSTPGGAQLQTPLWEGNLMDAPVFGGGGLTGVRQFAVEGPRVRAGLLHGLSDNTVVALVSDAAAGPDEILAYAQLEKSTARSAALAPVAGDCVASAQAPCAQLGALPQEARFARVVAKPLDTLLRIAPPVNLETGAALAEDDPLATALAAAISTANADLGTNIALSPEASVQTGVARDKLWFGPKLLAGAEPIGLSWSPGQAPLEDILLRISRAEEIARTFGNVAGTPSILFPNPLEILAQQVEADAGQIAPRPPTDLEGECAVAQSSGRLLTEILPGEGLKQCDILAFGAQGTVQGPARDVNRIYIDSQYCAHADYQRVEGVSVSAIIGEPIVLCSDCPTPDGLGVTTSTGVERLFLVVTEAERNREALDLRGLIENCAAPGESGTRAGAAQQVDGFLQTLGRSDPTRGGMGGFGITNIWVEKFTWQVLPRSAARAEAGLALND
ncbi:MAG: caspase family protein [Pseudomonadota bacterium]